MPEPGGEPANPQSPPGDWTRRTGQAFADGSALEALPEQLGAEETRCVEWCPICRGAEILRANASPELLDQWHGVQREALLTIRTLIDHYLERIDSEPREHGPRVEDIPIE